MARKSSSSPASRVKALPWAALLQGSLVVGRGVAELSDKDRARLTALLRESRGWPGRLGSKQRAELRKLIGKLPTKRMSRELMLVGGLRRRRGRRRR
jgi:hypothetical protein